MSRADCTNDDAILAALRDREVMPTYQVANVAGMRGQTAKVRRALDRLARAGRAQRADFRFWPYFGWKKPA